MLWEASVLDPVEVCTHILGASVRSLKVMPFAGNPFPWIIHSRLPKAAPCLTRWKGNPA